jgi:hypothetical protein
MWYFEEKIKETGLVSSVHPHCQTDESGQWNLLVHKDNMKAARTMADPANSTPNKKKHQATDASSLVKQNDSKARTSNQHHHQKIIRLRMSINTKTHKPSAGLQSISTTD